MGLYVVAMVEMNKKSQGTVASRSYRCDMEGRWSGQ